jgi:hypothetical protein
MSRHSPDAGRRRLEIERAFPALFPERPRRLPWGRWINIGFRTLHLPAAGILLGGHAFQWPRATWCC